MKNNKRSSLQLEPLETRRLLAADWQNSFDPVDVDASGEMSADAVSPLDALLVINELNDPQISDANGVLPPIGEDGPAPPYVDVDGNGTVSPLDALLVINQLATNSNTGGSEQSFSPVSFMAGSFAALSHDVENEDDDTLVNSTTDRSQSRSDAATNNGEVLVVWESLNQDGSSWGIYGQRYDATGAMVGSEFQINTTTRGPQRNPAVAMADDGSAMVVWQDDWADGQGWGIHGQALGADNALVGDEIVLNTTTRGSQSNPDIAEADGTYFVVWEGRGAGDNNGIFGATVDGSTLTASGESLVNSSTSGNQSHPAIDASADGIVVAWNGKGAGDNNGIFMTRSFGGDQIRVNSDTSGAQKHPSISVTDGGDIGVAWQNGSDVSARTFDSSGSATSDEFTANQTTRGAQKGPSIDHLSDGTAVVTWYGKGSGDHRGIFSRTFGTDSSDESQINHTTRAGQTRPTVIGVNDGFVTVWQGRGTGDHRGIFARFTDSEVSGPFSVDDIEDATVVEGDVFSTTVGITDIDGNADTPVFSLTTAPEGMTIDPSTGEISWTTGEADGPGAFEVVVVATEGEFTDSEMFIVNVSEANANPVLEAIADMTATPDTVFSFTPTATDADLPAQTLTYSAALADGSALPTWLNIDPVTGTLSGTPAETDMGGTVVITVTDSEGGSASEQFALDVSSNSGPIVANAVGTAAATEGTAFTLDVNNVFSDPDSDPLTLSVDGTLPSWLSFDPATGTFSGTPGNGDVGTETITIRADDGTESTTDTFTLNVSGINNTSPSILDQAFRISPTAANGSSVGDILASDGDLGDTLTYSITGGTGQSLFAIDSATGAITVTDNSTLTDPGTFDLTVQASDGTNTSDATVTVYATSTDAGVGYQLQAQDSDGNPITSVSAGDTFDLVMFVQDLRTTGATGVFSAFADIVYSTDLVTRSGNVVHSTKYMNAPSADIAVDGIIDEAGGVDGFDGTGDPEEVLRVQMTAGSLADGTSISFATNAADELPVHETTRFLDTGAIADSEISFGTLSLTVGQGSASAMAAMSSSTVVGDSVSTGSSELADSNRISGTQSLELGASNVEASTADLDYTRGNQENQLRFARLAIIDSVFDNDADEEETDWLGGL